MADKTVLHDLNSGMVLDRSVLITLTSADIEKVISNIRAADHKSLYVINGADTFFTPQTLVSLIAAKDQRVSLVNEGLGGFFTKDQMKVLVAGEIIAPAAVVKKDELIVNMAGEAPAGEQQQQQEPAPGYVFAQVPEGWSVGSHMSLGQTKIKRKCTSLEGDGTLFFMSPADYEKLWLFASKAWAGHDYKPTKFNTGVGIKLATVQDDRISLGGNYVRRYEIEQVAKYRNWAIPALFAQAAA